MDDRDILQLYLARDERALTETQKKYETYCHGIAASILTSKEDAEECINDTWLRAWQTIPPQRPDPLKYYIGRLCRCLCIDRYRHLHRHKRNREMDCVLNELDEVCPAEEVTSGLKDTLIAFLQELEPLERNLFVGRYWYAYSPEQLAEDQGLSRNAVNLRLMRTREKLKEYLQREGYTI